MKTQQFHHAHCDSVIRKGEGKSLEGGLIESDVDHTGNVIVKLHWKYLMNCYENKRSFTRQTQVMQGLSEIPGITTAVPFGRSHVATDPEK